MAIVKNEPVLLFTTFDHALQLVNHFDNIKIVDSSQPVPLTPIEQYSINRSTTAKETKDNAIARSDQLLQTSSDNTYGQSFRNKVFSIWVDTKEHEQYRLLVAIDENHLRGLDFRSKVGITLVVARQFTNARAYN